VLDHLTMLEDFFVNTLRPRRYRSIQNKNALGKNVKP